MKILAIDDNRDNLTALKAVVKNALPGCTVLTALNGSDGIELARTEDPDVILLDIIMPGVDGFAVCRRLKADEYLREIPVVFLTANRSDRENRVKALEAGAEAFLSKPPDEQELIAQIRAMTKIKAANQIRRLENERLTELVAVRTRELEQELAGRRRIEAEMARLIAAIEHAGEMIIVTDPQGTVQYVNSAVERVTGYARTEIVGQNIRSLKSGGQAVTFHRELWEIISSGRTWNGQIVNKSKDGALYTVEATISPVYDATGRIVNYVAVKRDITAHLQMEAQFIQAQKLEAVGRLTGGVAHDFNNLLTIIIGNADMAIGVLGKESPIQEFLKDIKGAGERAAGLTRQLLAFSRKQIFQPEVVNLNEVLDNVNRMLRRVIGEDIELKTILCPDLGQVEADVGQMEQVLMNLAVNARDAMPTGGKLTFETNNVALDETYAWNHIGVIPGRYVMLAISDTGIGMTKDLQVNIFEPFFTTKEKGKGTGLGLSTVYGIIKQSKGNIWVYSEPGKGSTFKIYLPKVEKKVRIKEEAAKTGESLQGSETILLVEDNEMVMNIALKALQIHGYTVLSARDGEEAIHISRQHKEPVQLMLTDVVMPGMSGRELAKRLEELRPEMKVLFMSGYTDNAIVHHGFLDKGIAFIQKPFTSVDLARKVRKVLDK